jgi:RNase P protein component
MRVLPPTSGPPRVVQSAGRPIYSMSLTVTPTIKRFSPLAVHRSAIRKRFRHVVRMCVTSEGPDAYLLDRHDYIVSPGQTSLRCSLRDLVDELSRAFREIKVSSLDQPAPMESICYSGWQSGLSLRDRLTRPPCTSISTRFLQQQHAVEDLADNLLLERC